MRSTNNQPKPQDVQQFVDDNFEDVNELLNATLPDWRENPSLLDRIEDENYREWASALNSIWKDLARKISTDVRDNPKRNSLIYVNNTFIIPGGRFKGIYTYIYHTLYWPSIPVYIYA